MSSVRTGSESGVWRVGFQPCRDHQRAGILRIFSILVLLSMPAGCERRSVEAPAEQVARGWELYRFGDFAPAAKAFESAIAGSQRGSEPWLAATYGLACTFNHRRPGEDRVRAAALYESVIAAAPEHDLSAWSLLALARMKHLAPVDVEPDLEAARAAYQRVIERFPRHLAGEEALVYLQSTFLANRDPAEASRALTALQAFLRDRPQTKFASAAWGLIAACHEICDEPDERLAAEIKALETREPDPTNPFHDNATAYWRIATIAEIDCGDFATARKYYNLFIAEYPNEARTFPTMQALERMDKLEATLRAEGRAR